MSGARFNIALRPSGLHRSLLLGAHAVLLLAVVALPVSVHGKGLLITALLINLGYLQRLLARQREIAQIRLESDQLSALRRGEWQSVDRLTPLLVSSSVTIIRIYIDGVCYVLPLWRDSADGESMRQLRVWLLCGGWKQSNANSQA